MCPIPPGSKHPKSKGCSSIVSLWWVSPLDSRAEGLLGQHWEGTREGVPSSESLIWASPCHCAPVLLHASADGPLMGWWLLGWAWEYLQAGTTWAPPSALSELLHGFAYEILSQNLALHILCFYSFSNLLYPVWLIWTWYNKYMGV